MPLKVLRGVREGAGKHDIGCARRLTASFQRRRVLHREKDMASRRTLFQNVFNLTLALYDHVTQGQKSRDARWAKVNILQSNTSDISICGPCQKRFGIFSRKLSCHVCGVPHCEGCLENKVRVYFHAEEKRAFLDCDKNEQPVSGEVFLSVCESCFQQVEFELLVPAEKCRLDKPPKPVGYITFEEKLILAYQETLFARNEIDFYLGKFREFVQKCTNPSVTRQTCLFFARILCDLHVLLALFDTCVSRFNSLNMNGTEKHKCTAKSVVRGFLLFKRESEKSLALLTRECRDCSDSKALQYLDLNVATELILRTSRILRQLAVEIKNVQSSRSEQLDQCGDSMNRVADELDIALLSNFLELSAWLGQSMPNQTPDICADLKKESELLALTRPFFNTSWTPQNKVDLLKIIRAPKVALSATGINFTTHASTLLGKLEIQLASDLRA
eukprot:m.53317 g.53317  ORF g.53317 m.53317 type:complete len:445 (+) comp10857_c0_seq2:2435-3769(+)